MLHLNSPILPVTFVNQLGLSTGIFNMITDCNSKLRLSSMRLFAHRCQELQSHPAFMSEMDESRPMSAAMEGLQALKYESESADGLYVLYFC